MNLSVTEREDGKFDYHLETAGGYVEGGILAKGHVTHGPTIGKMFNLIDGSVGDVTHTHMEFEFVIEDLWIEEPTK